MQGKTEKTLKLLLGEKALKMESVALRVGGPGTRERVLHLDPRLGWRDIDEEAGLGGVSRWKQPALGQGTVE